MSCMIMSDNVKMMLTGSGNGVLMTVTSPEATRPAYSIPSAYSSVFQSPDVSRLALSKILRQGEKGGASPRRYHAYWSGFMAAILLHTANSNGAA